MTTFTMPAALAWYDISHDEDGEQEIEFSAYPRKQFEPLYTAEALRDVLQQAAKVCESMQYVDKCTPSNCADAIRSMMGEIK